MRFESKWKWSKPWYLISKFQMFGHFQSNSQSLIKRWQHHLHNTREIYKKLWANFKFMKMLIFVSFGIKYTDYNFGGVLKVTLKALKHNTRANYKERKFEPILKSPKFWYLNPWHYGYIFQFFGDLSRELQKHLQII